MACPLRFAVAFATADALETRLALSETRQGGMVPMRLLVVEDDRRVSSFIQRGLVQEGFCVDVALDGRDAFHLALNEAYDLIVLDVVIPHMDGFQVVSEIRRHGCSVPV